MSPPPDFDPAESRLERPPRVYGFVRAVVTANQGDPQNLARIQVSYINFPQTGGVSAWARLVTPMAGAGYGMCFIPEVDDEVIVLFEQGDIDLPVIAGAVWNGAHLPPYNNEDKSDNLRKLRSRSGHTVLLDDTKGAEQIVIVDKTEQNKITFDSVNNVITIASSKDVQVTTKGNLALSSDGDVTIGCNNFKVTAQASVSIEAQGASLDLKCMPGGVKLNTDGLVVK